MNTFQHEKGNVAFKLLEWLYKKKSNDEIVHRWIGELRVDKIKS